MADGRAEEVRVVAAEDREEALDVAGEAGVPELVVEIFRVAAVVRLEVVAVDLVTTGSRAEGTTISRRTTTDAAAEAATTINAAEGEVATIRVRSTVVVWVARRTPGRM